MHSLQISLFGAIHVQLDGKSVTLAYDKVRALLAYLAIESDKPLRRETLTGLLWPEQTENEARHSLSQALFKLRQAIDPENNVVLANRHTVQINLDADIEFDTAVFTTTLLQCQTHKHAQPDLCEECMARRETAVSLYKGPFLAGLSLPDAPRFEQWQTQQREQFQRKVMEALSKLTTCFGQRGELEKAIQFAQQQLASEPWREEAHFQLMRLFLYNSQRSSAIAQYLTCVQALANELGVEPSPKTKDLYKLIQTAKANPPQNLPIETTPFVGRESEISQITSMLAAENSRLITIVGPGGMGKSRLALAMAQRQLGRPIEAQALNTTTYAFFTHGVYWISLVGVETAISLVPTIAEALGFQLENATETPIRSAQQQLVDYLRQKRILLVLDNFEQLLTTAEAQEATAVLYAILHNAPNVQLIVTSRERLQLPQEQLHRLHGLDYPKTDTDTEYAALTLFIRTAQRIRSDFQLDQERKTAVAHICRLLQGMPLAIELAAAAINILSPTQLGTELAKSLDLLGTTTRHIPERHRSIRAAFDMSWRRLSTDEQTVFQSLSTFRGGFSRAAAQAVTGASLSILTKLVNKSFVRFSHETHRYEIHELMRQFGEEKLLMSSDQSKQVRDRHSAYFSEKLEHWVKWVKAAQQKKAFHEMALNSENIRLAWLSIVEHAQVKQFAQAADGLGFLYQWQGRYQEAAELYKAACQMLQMAPANEGDVNDLLIKSLTWQGLFRHSLDQTESANILFEEALKLNENKSSLLHNQPHSGSFPQAFLWYTVGETLLRSSMREQAKIYLEKSLAAYESRDDAWGKANAFNCLGILARELGDYPVAKNLIENSVKIRKKIGDHVGLADSLGWLGLIEMDMGAFDQAEAFMLQQLVLNRELNSDLGVASSLDRLGLLHLFRGEFEAAQSKFQNYLEIMHNLGIEQKTGMTNCWLGIAYFNQGMYQEARNSAMVSLSIAEDAKNLYAIGHAKMLLGYTQLARGEIDIAEECLKECIELFQEIGQRDELSQAWAWMSYVKLTRGQLIGAERCLATCLELALEIGTYLPIMEALPAVTKLLVFQEKLELSIEIYAMAMQLPGLAHSMAFNDLVGRLDLITSKLLSPKVTNDAQERGRQRELWETAATLLDEFTESSH